MPADGSVGMDHDHYDWSPLSTRSAIRWPDDKPLALGAMVLLEHYEWYPPEDAYTLRTASGGLIKLPDPDYLRLTHREYGHRVGIFRVLDTLDAHGIPATVAVDVLTAEHYPWLVDHCLERGCELVAHGVAASRLVTSKMSEEEEADTIARSIDAITSASGTRPRGWFGPEGSESARTPAVVAAAGLDYLCDWPNDEQPYDMTVPSGQLTSMPLYLEADDEHSLWTRRMRLSDWQDSLVETAAMLHSDGAETGRLLMPTLRPWLSGQPFRIPVLDAALDAIDELGSIFKGTASEIVDAYRQNS